MIKNITKERILSWPTPQIFSGPDYITDWPAMVKKYNKVYKKWDLTVRK